MSASTNNQQETALILNGEIIDILLNATHEMNIGLIQRKINIVRLMSDITRDVEEIGNSEKLICGAIFMRITDKVCAAFANRDLESVQACDVLGRLSSRAKDLCAPFGVETNDRYVSSVEVKEYIPVKYKATKRSMNI